VRHPPLLRRARWSFTALSARLDDVAPPTGEPDDGPAGGHDEPVLDEPVPPEPVAVPCTLADVPGGTAFGTVVHRILEQVDAASPTLVDDLRAAATIELGGGLSRISPDALAVGLDAALHARLGGPLGARRLVDVGPADRLTELAFDLPLGDTRLADIGAVLATTLRDDDPFLPWARAVAAEAPELDLAGMLTGSIDLVARHTDDGTPRFWVADYKTNRLGDRYDRDEMIDEMIVHHYPLQAALYLVALHRYLRWRLPTVVPESQLVGAAYLFVRGMSAAGDEAAAPGGAAPGVLWWQPGVAAIAGLDALLAGRRS
jgi:exodeoxyribonuclease V beta subunit